MQYQARINTGKCKAIPEVCAEIFTPVSRTERESVACDCWAAHPAGVRPERSLAARR